jgi:protein gp37
VRFVSAEPLMGRLDLTTIDHERDRGWEEPLDALRPYSLAQAREEWGEDCDQVADRPGLDLVIDGGESGPGARPTHPDWFRKLRDDCAAADVAYFHKQNGAWVALESGDGYWPITGRGAVRLRPDGTQGADGWPMQRVGKKAAGRLLDGRTHDDMPEVRA